jgi:hypothetical protein
MPSSFCESVKMLCPSAVEMLAQAWETLPLSASGLATAFSRSVAYLLPLQSGNNTTRLVEDRGGKPAAASKGKAVVRARCRCGALPFSSAWHRQLGRPS